MVVLLRNRFTRAPLSFQDGASKTTMTFRGEDIEIPMKTLFHKVPGIAIFELFAFPIPTYTTYWAFDKAERIEYNILTREENGLR